MGVRQEGDHPVPHAGRIGHGTSVAANAIIGADVVIGDRCEIGPNCVIEGRVTIGDGTILAAGCVIGSRSRPAIRQGHRPRGRVEIGADVVVLEHAVINAPLEEITRVGDRCAIGALGLVAHDADLGADVILAPQCALGGYVCVGEWANLGLGVRVHPRLVVGVFAMCGMGAVVTKHVAPGATVQGNPARAVKANELGMERGGIADDDRAEWADALLSGRQPRPDGALALHIEVFQRQMARWGRSRTTLPGHPWLSS